MSRAAEQQYRQGDLVRDLARSQREPSVIPNKRGEKWQPSRSASPGNVQTADPPFRPHQMIAAAPHGRFDVHRGQLPAAASGDGNGSTTSADELSKQSLRAFLAPHLEHVHNPSAVSLVGDLHGNANLSHAFDAVR